MFGPEKQSFLLLLSNCDALSGMAALPLRAIAFPLRGNREKTLAELEGALLYFSCKEHKPAPIAVAKVARSGII